MKVRLLVVLSLIFLGSVFLPWSKVLAANTDIVITEIGAYEASGNEWVEIYNKGNDPVDLTGWKFWEDGTNHGLQLKQGGSLALTPGAYAVITQNDVNFRAAYPGVTTTILDSAWGTLNESGEEIGLKDASGAFIERFTYIEAKTYALERKDAGRADYSANNWLAHPNGNTVGARNYWTSPPATTQSTSTFTSTSTLMATSSSVGNVTVKINEFLPDPNQGENEWIELYNTGSSTVALLGWTIADGVGTIVTASGTLAASGLVVFDLSGAKLNNDGDIIILKDGNAVVVDQVSYGNWNDGNAADNALAPARGNSLARAGDGADTAVDKTDFVVSVSPTKGQKNTAATSPGSSVPPVSQPSSGVGSGASGTIVGYPTRAVVINELVSDPADGQVEFVELYSLFGRPIDLSGWWLEDGGETKTLLAGTIQPGGFFVVEKPKGDLNNAGDRVELYDSSGSEIDAVTYGAWNDGNVSDNASRADDPLSLARRADGVDADNDFYDFAVTTNVTKGRPNVISLAGTMSSGMGQKDVKVIINELLPNPAGSDIRDEFIELKNNGETRVDLNGWFIGDDSSKRYTFTSTSGSIAPGGYFVAKRSLTGLALNNSGGDEVAFYQANGLIIDKVRYGEVALEDYSYARGSDGKFVWTSRATPGADNIVVKINRPPVVVIETETEVAVGERIVFDGSDTSDPDGDGLSFAWDFGDGTRGAGETMSHEYIKAGRYRVTLTATDANGGAANKTVVVTVKTSSSFVGGSLTAVDLPSAAGVLISEIFPNPVGSDAVEFIELFNAGDTVIDLSGFQLADEPAGSRPYRLAEGAVIQPGAYLIFNKSATRLTLNNTGDAIHLLSPNDQVLQTVEYSGEVTEGASYARRADGNWQWTTVVTPGALNVFSEVRVTASSGSKGASVVRRASAKGIRDGRVKAAVETTLEKIREFDVGDRVKVTGVVAVEPGIIGTQIFYLVGSQGIQVYQHKKDFPALSMGDRVAVTGEISQIYGETRLKAASRSDIVKLDHQGEPAPALVEVADIGEPLEGALVRVAGEVTELKASYLYVDDGTEEVKVYFKKGAEISRQTLAAGALVKITGLVSQTRGGYQLLPRGQADIEKTGTVAEAAVAIESAGQAPPGEVAEKYLTATAGGLTSILIGLFAKARGAAIVAVLRRVGRLVWIWKRRG